jgi:outer membrane protein assembly factor BamB
MKNIYWLIGLCILFVSCSKELDTTTDSTGVVLIRPHIWVKSITDDGELMNSYFVYRKTQYNDNLLIGIRKKGLRYFQLTSTIDGSAIWDWYDIIEERSYLEVEQPVIVNNYFIWQANYWNYCIDLNTGKTIWKNSFQENYGELPSNLGKTFIGMYNYDKNGNRPLEGGNACFMSQDNGKPYFYITPRYDTTGMQPFSISQRRGEIRFNKLFIEKTDTFLLMSIIDPPLYDYKYREYLSLYNLTKKQWIYERADMLGTSRFGITHEPYIYQVKVYTPFSGSIVCNDLMTGKKLWQSDVEAGTAFTKGGIIVVENKIYGNSSEGYLYSWDLETGQQLWRVRTSGMGSEFGYINGVLYFTGAGDGKLHAIEASSGKYLWKLSSPDVSKNKLAYFVNMYAIEGKKGEKGKIIALTGLNAYCYEAER